MDKKGLSSEQEWELVDFLKRWGIDSPELLAEMADHYTEKALEEMAAGKTWERVIDSWKTKKTFSYLRTIESKFKPARKKQWRRLCLKSIKEVLLGKPVLIVVAAFLLCFILLQIDRFPTFIFALFLFKSLLSLGIYFWLHYFGRDYKELYAYGKLKAVFMIEVYPPYLLLGLKTKFFSDTELEINFVLFTSVFFALTIAVNMVACKIYKSIEESAESLSDQMLAPREKPQPR